MFYGVAYYPEHKNAQELEHDLQLLIDSGINTVRMGEFAWSRFEPKEGEFHFDWLDYAVERLGKNGVKTVICTPTACPPAWLVEKHPDLLYTDNRGVTRPFGGRRHYCYNNENFRRYSAIITEQIAVHYGKNPYVIGFQIDNEPAQEATGRCCCPDCTAGFHKYLEHKYHTVEEFNRRIGGVFWSSEYGSFSQVPLPLNPIEVGAVRHLPAHREHPSIVLEFERFSSDSQIDYQNIQTRILKAHSDYPVTTNGTGLATNSIDYFKSFAELDCYAFDFYPGLRDAFVDSFPYAFGRGAKDGKPFWVLEFMSGGGHSIGGRGRIQSNPGALKQAVVQSFAHGAEMMLHFQYRTFPFGAEQLNYAIVDMDGVPRRRYYEMADTAKLLRQLEPIAQAQFPRETAVCFDYDCHWALRIKPLNDPDGFHYIKNCASFYRALMMRSGSADVVSLGQDWSRYKVVVLPAAIILSPEHQEKARQYVKDGGTLIATFVTSVKNEDNVGYTQTLPAGLTDVFGVTVEEVEPVAPLNQLELSLQVGNQQISTPDLFWSELLGGEAEMIGHYTQDYKTGTGVISRHAYGKGQAYYLGTGLPQPVLESLIAHICEDAGVHKQPFNVQSDAQIEIVHRVLDGKDCYFLFNFEKGTSKIEAQGSFTDYLTGKKITGCVEVERNGVRVLVRA